MTLTFKIFLVVAVLALLFVFYLAILGHNSRSGEAAGLADGRLKPCPDKPNCVCSEYPGDGHHSIAALPLPGTTLNGAIAALTATVDGLGGRVVEVSDNYLAATFASSLFGFVDDVEFRIDLEAGQVQVRSAARVGHSDLGANRKRIEAIRARLPVGQAGS